MKIAANQQQPVHKIKWRVNCHLTFYGLFWSTQWKILNAFSGSELKDKSKQKDWNTKFNIFNVVKNTSTYNICLSCETALYYK